MIKIKLNSRLISEIGVKEKYIRKEHFNSIKVWWARRPITAMRNLLIQEILKRRGVENEVDYELISELNPSLLSFGKFSKEYNTKNISVLDVFSGGGSIPFESSRLGCQTYSSELNPIAALAQKTVFDSLKIKNFSTILKKEGLRVIETLEQNYSNLYTFEDNSPYVFFWSKTMRCGSCNKDFNLARIKYFSKRKNNVKYMHCNGIIDNNDSNLNGVKGFFCEHCTKEYSFTDIKEYCKSSPLGDSLLAICNYNGKKEYKSVNSNCFNLDVVNKKIDDLLHNLHSSEIDWGVESRGGVINPTLYDLKNAGNFFNKRQHLIILGLINCIKDYYPKWIESYDKNMAQQLVYSLTPLIEFLVDWNSKGTMWISQNEQTGRSLAGPGVGMKWDYIEINPFFSKGSNLKSKLLRVCESFKAISHDSNISIFQGTSTNLPMPTESVDIVLTDPPYYDSIEYTALSEFFRPWFELLLKNTCNGDISLKNDETQEAIVELHKSKKNKKDNNHYKTLMTNVLLEVQRVLKSNGSCLLLYSHKTFEGWEVIANAIHDAGLYISDCYPIEMERIARPRAMQYDALNGVIVFRIIKDSSNIQPVENDINNIDNLMKSKDILESHIVIYLASLACKELCLRGDNFNDTYRRVISYYEALKLEKWDKEKMDNLSRIYLLSRISQTILSERDSNVLNEKGLLNKDGFPISIVNIDKNNIPQNTNLYKAIELFAEFKKNSKTKISIDKISEELLFFISCISGLNLNTVKKRSSSDEAKIARLIISKIS